MKRDVLRAIGDYRRGSGDERDIGRALARLESFASDGDVRGRWTLVYSAKLDGGANGANGEAASSPLEFLGVSDEIVQEVTKVLYGMFFKFAPWLAGSAETNRTGARNIQVVDVDAGTVRNEVDLDVPRLPTFADVVEWGDKRSSTTSTLKIGVDGEIEVEDGLARRAYVTFTRFDAQVQFARDRATPKVSFPLPRPRGSLNTTFCDDSMRISRGGRGGVFVLTRLT